MKPRLISILTALTALTATSYADEYGQSFDSISMYSSELQLDIYGAYAFAGNDGGSIFGEDTPGAGAALNLYITRNIGIGLEGMLFDTDGDTMGSAALNLFLRTSARNHLARRKLKSQAAKDDYLRLTTRKL